MPVLSLQTDYALRTLMFLASNVERRCQIPEIAKYHNISRDHLAKAARRLAQDGFIRSIRGVGGGIELALPADKICLGEVIRHFEGNLSMLDCTQIDNVCRIQCGCRLRGVLMEAERRQWEYLDTIFLSDVVESGDDLVELNSLSTG
ncbi:MAG: Rrf2 family transcriptional regulator [Planctomycetaceae bacterium]